MTDKERELLLILQEECAEVIQAISKIFRFGIDTEWNGESNRNSLEEEIGDLICMIEMTSDSKFNICNIDNLILASVNKEQKLRKYSSLYKD